MAKVQKLYETCVATFATLGAAPPPDALQHLQSVLDAIQPIDVGLEEEANGQHDLKLMVNGGQSRIDPPWNPPITYLHIHDCPNFEIAIFCLSASAVMPLHNHPGMTVLSKLIYGSMHVRAYDWLDPHKMLDADFSQPRQARLVMDEVLCAPCTPSILYPTFGGNIHTFTAASPCAVLDVLAPPYDTEAGRDPTYFQEVPESNISGTTDLVDNVVWLKEVKPPDDFVVPRRPYKGPSVVMLEAA